jgi:hypothetical protein
MYMKSLGLTKSLSVIVFNLCMLVFVGINYVGWWLAEYSPDGDFAMWANFPDVPRLQL